MTTIHFQKATYFTSAVELSQLPPDTGAEIAFIGRSNAGKSSALNAITGVKGLARVSQTPGRTQMINLFSLDESHRLVDLPGYGYAKAPSRVSVKWGEMTANYLEYRASLAGLVLIMDARHPFKPADMELIDWSIDFSLRLHILLTKADKLNNSAQQKTVQTACRVLSDAIDAGLASVQLFSAVKKMGIAEAREQLTQWFRD